MTYFVAFLLGHLLFVLLFWAWAKTGWRVFAAAGLPLDVLYNFTTVALFLGRPQAGEWTISKRLKRQRYDEGRRGLRAHRLAKFANRIAPGHI